MSESSCRKLASTAFIASTLASAIAAATRNFKRVCTSPCTTRCTAAALLGQRSGGLGSKGSGEITISISGFILSRYALLRANLFARRGTGAPRTAKGGDDSARFQEATALSEGQLLVILLNCT